MKSNHKVIFLKIVIAILFIVIISLSIHLIYIIYYNNHVDDVFLTQMAKPIIYIYPKEELELTIKLGKSKNLTCSYPKYKNGWNITAKPDGNIIDLNTGKTLYALYWEGKCLQQIQFSEGFCIKGEDSATFLEEKLNFLGLNEKESEEFIIYWLPILEKNKYNIIKFASMDEINNYMPLDFSVKPDTLIRILMEFKSSNNYINIPEQKLESSTRNGFTIVEWGAINCDESFIK